MKKSNGLAVNLIFRSLERSPLVGIVDQESQQEGILLQQIKRTTVADQEVKCPLIENERIIRAKTQRFKAIRQNGVVIRGAHRWQQKMQRGEAIIYRSGDHTEFCIVEKFSKYSKGPN
eukprot:TRINITY_DN4446_c0_g2_i1.p1 TRINITY_DN4446_c0_g2~~TRINITY_DN4446_c0_g2_i1.p1  ORF type:complete len:118 (+),score=15.27 TRINITY_DN4446_c0_g2_i1:764-1117(+)